MPVPHERIAWMELGEAFFLHRLDAVSDDQLREQSGLPEWTRAHVVSHFSRNALALVNLLDWARTGVATPMYPSVEARSAGIEEGATQTASELRAEALAASKVLRATVVAMPDDAWDGEIRTALGRATTGAEVPWMRVRETWVHALDLDAGASVDEVPADVVAALLDEVTATLGAREGTPAVLMVADDTGREWTMGAAPDPTVLTGRQAALLAWVIGRSPGDDLQVSRGTVPAAPRWL